MTNNRPKKRALVSVTNDLVTDRRVDKMCRSLQALGFEVLLVGRVLPGSLPLGKRSYVMHRMRLLFKKGPLFYAFFNIRLFFFLLFRRADVLVANDLDTLAANFLVARLRGRELVYDSHEYFTEVPELQGRAARQVWLFIERLIFPRLRHVITVNPSIAQAYEQRYGLRPEVVRNLPECNTLQVPVLSKTRLGIPDDHGVVILQGSGINIDRGGEEAVLAMKEVRKAVLLIVGDGDALPTLRRLVHQHRLHDKVIFISRRQPSELYAYTSLADVGLSLDKDTNLNYRYSLPNKIFDYIRCAVPVLASNLPEVAAVVRQYGVGRILETYDVHHLARCINTMLDDNDKEHLRDKLHDAARQLCWENEKTVIEKIYRPLL